MRCLCSFATGWKALHILFELKQLAEHKPRPADKLVVLAECKPRPADKLEESAERKKPRPAGKLIVLAERKPRPADKIEFAERKSRPAGNIKFAERKPRPAGNLYWELLVAAIGCSAKDSGSDFYCGIAHKFEYLSNQYSCLEALHPALAHCMLLKFSVVKGCLEALHPNPFV